MYKRILVAVDNSEWSDRAVDLALALAEAGGASLTASHVYAARLHDLRFRQLEPGLPERYRSAEVLGRLRSVHDPLIGRGLAIISDSYLDAVEQRCREAQIPFARQACEGRNYEQLLRQANSGQYDLVALGAHGLGKCKRSLVGSVCERLVRGAKIDVLVARCRGPLRGAGIAVAVDGSDCSFAAARRAINLARLLGARLTAIAVYDPFFHRVAFGSIAEVLSAEAAKLFRFREQELLHDEIIDRGLMALYQAHLDRVAEMAASAGVPLKTMVLQGKPYDALLDYVEEEAPSLLIMGRIGFHHAEGTEIGSNVENVLRLAPCNVLVAGTPGEGEEGAQQPAQGDQLPKSLPWTPEAEARLARVPPFVRGMARRSIGRYALKKGYAAVTPAVMDEARRRIGL